MYVLSFVLNVVSFLSLVVAVVAATAPCILGLQFHWLLLPSAVAHLRSLAVLFFWLSVVLRVAQFFSDRSSRSLKVG